MLKNASEGELLFVGSESELCKMYRRRESTPELFIGIQRRNCPWQTKEHDRYTAFVDEVFKPVGHPSGLRARAVAEMVEFINKEQLNLALFHEMDDALGFHGG